MREHFVIGETRRGLLTICGDEIHPTPPPSEGATRCAECEKRVAMVDTACAYANSRRITPEDAARALNMPDPVVRACMA